MIKINDKSKCSGCHACANSCPTKCISMVVDSEGFLYPNIDLSKCVSCGKCERACPILTPITKGTRLEEDIIAYGAYTKNDEVRINSSSGGLFTELAECVISIGGVVCGAAFNDDFSVSHKFATTNKELEQFRGSKYVQSAIENSYREAKIFLDEGRTVLFTGTPCQIGGLYSYLNKDYDNLITQDIICHGVPSPMVWQKYLDYHRQKRDAAITEVSFRNKSQGWKTFSMMIGFNDGINYQCTAGKDPYMRAFFRNFCLRPSCYNCSFKDKIRLSDITLADFWGGNKLISHMDDNKGLSLVIINSKKGLEIFNKIKGNLIVEQVPFNEAISFNSAMVKSVPLPVRRKSFIKKIKSEKFDEVVDKYAKKSPFKRFILKAKKTIKKVIKR